MVVERRWWLSGVETTVYLPKPPSKTVNAIQALTID
jgi:hypothetical protein